MASSYGRIDGLPTADDYDPDALGTVELVAGEPEQEWPQYGLEVVPIFAESKTLEREDTGRRFIMRNGKYVGDVSEYYKLLPNERAVEAANEVARDLGAVPFHDFGGDWYVELQDHVFQDSQRHRVHALYAWDDPVTIQGDDDVQMGFAVHNSIDGSLSFQVGLFTFRHACSNMVMMGVDGRGMGFDQREVLQHATKAHMSGLEVETDELAATVKNMLTLTDEVTETYRAWTEQTIGHEEVLSIVDRAIGSGQIAVKDLPEWIADIVDTVKDAKKAANDDDRNLTLEERADIVKASLPSAEPVWDVYNDLTEAVWHDDGTTDTSKQGKMRDIHRVLVPADGVA